MTRLTPEGLNLPKPLIFPDVRSFTDLLTVDGPWDFATMNHRNGEAPPERPADLTRPAPLHDYKIIGRFCSVRQMPQGSGRVHMVTTPTDLLRNKIWQDEDDGLDFAFFDRVGFQAIYHPNNDRVLLIADASSIIASRWLAYVPLDTVPAVAPATL